MPEKLGNGGYSQENYDPETGKYVKDPDSSSKTPSWLMGKASGSGTSKPKWLTGDKTTKSKINSPLSSLLSSLMIQKDGKIITLKDFSEKRQQKLANVRRRVDPELMKRASENLTRLINSSKTVIGTLMGSETVLSLFSSGHLMNQFESQTSRGAFSSRWRKELSKKMFNTPVEMLSGSELYDLEKYGCMKDSDPAEFFENRGKGDWYGDSMVCLKKDKVKNRITYTLGDSLDNSDDNNRHFLPQILSGQLDEFTFGQCDEVYDSEINQQFEDIAKADSIRDIEDSFYSWLRGKYIELQLHGDFTLEDIDKIYIGNKGGRFGAINFNRKSPELIDMFEKAKKHDIKLIVKQDGRPKEVYMEDDIVKYKDYNY